MTPAHMRLRYSAAALWALARRWGAFVLVLAALLGQYAGQAIGWPALPLFWAVSLPLWPGIAVVVAHALVATMLSWALRDALLPRHWLEAERALPQPRAAVYRADAAVVALAQAPLLLLHALSWLSWRLHQPAWMHGLWLGSAVAFAASLLLGLALGVLLLRWRRQPGRARWMRGTQIASASRPRVWAALLLMPLWRGPARPLGLWLLAVATGLLICLQQAWHAPEHLRWWLAGYAFVALLGSSRALALAERDLQGLVDASLPLPLPARAWHHARRMLALAPVLLCWPLLLLMMLAGPWQLAPLAGPLSLLAALLAPVLALYLPADPGRKGDEIRAARWLLFLAVWIVLVTECLKA
ncbi:hypothetical protein [Roseateles microcysteis]|uniref:hypothetical protein n=1 Tax=Roseateles microcysteis TaxID=3119057 RepID=UPI002FE62D8C